VDTGKPRSDGQTIARAVAIMKVLADRPGASFGQIAKATGLPPIGDSTFAISIAMPSPRFERLKEDIQDALLSTRDKVIAEYGRSI
jgi:DNA-binding IclR family transcriptional regulator